ncbi:ribonuclease H-like domain-containing protein [Tanacetum coccineum]
MDSLVNIVMGQAQSLQPGTTVSANTLGQARLLPQAFTIGTLYDPTNGAYGYSFSVKDFMTRWVLLRCDSTGDLYPVTSPSPIPHAFLYLADGTLSRYKAWLVANGSTQLEGVDVDETFSPVVKHGTIWTRSLYWLKQAPRAWFWRFASYITRVGFHHGRCDTSLFIYRQGMDTAYLLLYVDDIVITASSSDLLQRIIRSLHQEFAMTDLGLLNYFLGISVTRDSSGMFLFQKKYDVEILERAGMYRGVANAVAETCWLRNLLRELHTPLSSSTLVYCDNVSAVYLSCNPVQHQRTKHIEIDIYFVRDLVAANQVRVLHVPSRYQFADIFTKGLPSALFEEFRSSLSVRSPPAPTAGEC